MSQVTLSIHTPFAQSLGWTLVHFIWEGAVLAALLMAAMWVLRAEPAQRRYSLACLILTAMPIAFAVTLAVIWARRPVAIATPLHWTPLALSDGPIYFRAPRFSWAGILDRLAWLVPVWFGGVAFFYARGLAGWIAVRRLRRRGVCAPPAEWQARLDRLAVRLRISRPVALLESCFTDTPVLIGYLRPVILLPLGCLTGLSVVQVECILLHELAHVARHDYVVNLLQSLVEGLLFYHPAVWWVSRVVRAERENCCDDRVVSMMGDARAYAATLAALEQRRAPVPEAALAATGGNLIKRIRRLTREPRAPQMSVAPAFSAAMLLVIFAAALTALPVKLPKIRHARYPAATPLAVAAATPQEPVRELTTPYKKWLNEDVAYIINDEERTAFLKLGNDAQREHFIDEFWKQRDPTPGTEQNEFREEHYRRLAYANEKFTGSVAGWKTDRGRMYIQYGPPDEIDAHSAGGSYQRPAQEGGGTVETYPFQQWRYRFIEGIGTNVTMEFVDRFGTGDYPMTTDPSEKEKNPFQAWLHQDVAYIVTAEERAQFQKLATNQEREAFIERFWSRRSPGAKEEHYRRIAYANEHFHAAGPAAPGWSSDMGRTYIVYGPPDQVTDARQANIVWTYRNIDGAGATFVFGDADRSGAYRLLSGPGVAQDARAGQDDDASVFASSDRTAVSVIVPGKGHSVSSGVIGVGDLLDVEYVTTGRSSDSTSLEQVINSKSAECAALSQRYAADFPDVMTCKDQVAALRQRSGEIAANSPQSIPLLESEENQLRAQFSASRLQVEILQHRLDAAVKELKAAQDRIKPEAWEKWNMLQAQLSRIEENYKRALQKDADGPFVKQLQQTLALKQLKLAAFSQSNFGSLPEDLKTNILDIQSKQTLIADLDRTVSDEQRAQQHLESRLNDVKTRQAEAYGLSVARQIASNVQVADDGKIFLGGKSSVTAAGMTPAQLATVLGPNSTVRIAQTVSQMVTVLVPLSSTQTNFHVFGEIRKNQKLVQNFDRSVSGQPALAKAMPLTPGSYHLAVFVKNMASGEIRKSDLDFNVR